VVLQCGRYQKPNKIFSINLLQLLVTRNHGRKVVYQISNLQRTFIYAKEYFSRNFRNGGGVQMPLIDLFPNISIALRIFYASRVSRWAKCTFSLETRVKNYQRSPTTQDRLNELATRSKKETRLHAIRLLTISLTNLKSRKCFIYAHWITRPGLAIIV